MTFSEARTWLVVHGLGLGLAAACGGQSNQPAASTQIGGASAATGAEAGAGGSGLGGKPAAAGSVSTGGQAGAWQTECDPAVPVGCGDGAVVRCNASGEVELTECSPYEACSEEGGPHCELADLPLGMQENEFGFAWRDAFLLLPCYAVEGYDCLTIPSGQACPNLDATNFADRGLVLTETFEIGGEVGKVYNAHLIINGIVSGKYYEGGIRDRGSDFSNHHQPAGTDAFHRGGRPIPSTYDVWQIIVRRSTGEVFGNYYLNSYPQASGLESHQVVSIGYEKDIEVPGGGAIEYRVHDSNCRAVNNCGPGGVNCPASRNVPNEPGLALPENWHGQPLSSFNVVNGGQQPFHAQLTHVRVTKITYLKDIEPPEESCDFADPTVREAVLAWLGLPGPQVPLSKAVEVVSLSLVGRDVQSLEGIECLVFLNDLALDTSFTAGSLDLSPLAQLEYLDTLSLSGNSLVDISDLASLTHLETLVLSGNEVADLSPLGSAEALVVLDISDNAVTSLTPLVGLPSLRWLYATGNALDCAQQAVTLDTLCAKLLPHGEWHVDCGPQPSSTQTQCPGY